MIYLDNAATTKPSKKAVDMIVKGLECFGNPSSLHGVGLSAEKLMRNARGIIAKSLGVNDDEIFFTSGATESNNTALFGSAKAHGKRRKKIITTTIEHPSVAQPCDELEKQGFEVVRIAPNENGAINPEDILAEVDDNTLIVSCMLVNNETGYCLPIEKIFPIIKRKYPDVITHCDCVQGYMKLPVKAKKLGADLISLSGHKVHGPKGIGILYVKKGVNISPLVYGGGQEKAFRSGTESVPLICGFSAAVEELDGDISQRYQNACAIRDKIFKMAENMQGVHINSSADASPYVVSIGVEKIKSETMLHYLESKEIYVSSGSACSKGKKSSVLSQFGIDEKYLDSTIRISICCDTSEEDIDRLFDEIANAQKNLAKMK